MTRKNNITTFPAFAWSSQLKMLLNAHLYFYSFKIHIPGKIWSNIENELILNKFVRTHYSFHKSKSISLGFQMSKPKYKIECHITTISVPFRMRNIFLHLKVPQKLHQKKLNSEQKNKLPFLNFLDNSKTSNSILYQRGTHMWRFRMLHY